MLVLNQKCKQTFAILKPLGIIEGKQSAKNGGGVNMFTGSEAERLALIKEIQTLIRRLSALLESLSPDPEVAFRSAPEREWPAGPRVRASPTDRPAA